MRAPLLSIADFTARLAETPEEVADALALRARAFRADAAADDRDAFDATAQHMLIEQGGVLCATYRFHVHPSAAAAEAGYVGQVYRLAPLAALGGPLVELGRFCVAPDASAPAIVRLSWAALTRIVDEADAVLLFGCGSFVGADPARHAAGLGHLARHHLGPDTLRPRAKPRDAVPLRADGEDDPRAVASLPPLLRSYLGLGGWVSDAAVRDHDLDTLHVFTGVEIGRIPPARARALRLLAN